MHQLGEGPVFVATRRGDDVVFELPVVFLLGACDLDAVGVDDDVLPALVS